MATNEYRCSQCGICPAEKYPILYWRGKFYCRHCFQKEVHKIEQDVQKEKVNSLMDELRLQNDKDTPDELMEFIIEKKRFPPIPKHRLTPKEIVAYLDQYVIGQDQAKKTLSVAVYNHYRRIENDSKSIPKSNILMQGPTGTGKTFLLKILAELLDVPLAIVDASTISEVSYRGKDPESILTDLYLMADKDIKKAQSGVIYLDEFDKLSGSLGHKSNGTTKGEGVQRELLKIIEGCIMNIPQEGSRINNNIPMVQINTENILFVCGGAFVGIHKEEEKRKRRIGYLSELEPTDSQTVQRRLTPQDFIDYGLIPEMVGRLPVIVELDELTEEDLIDILLHSKSSFLKAYQVMMKEEGVELIFEKEAIWAIAEIAMKKGTGARGLNAIIERLMENLLFEIPSDKSICKCIITKDVVLGKKEPIIERNGLQREE